MVHWHLDVHAIDRDNSSVLQLHCHVLQRGQTQGDRACAHGILIVCTLKQWNGRKMFPFGLLGIAKKLIKKIWKPHRTYLYIFDNDRKLTVCAVSCQQVLTAASEGEELVVKGLEVRLTHHQALTCIDRTLEMNSQKTKMTFSEEH